MVQTLLMIDTAGRLQNRADLMEELAKIVRVIRKKDVDAPHNTLLVLDATTGQNALAQVEIFRKIADVTGLVMTKLDGTARGGVLVALADRFGLPIHAIGVGEQIDDLAPFDPGGVRRRADRARRGVSASNVSSGEIPGGSSLLGRWPSDNGDGGWPPMSDWLISLEGTGAGTHLATALAIMAAFLHAVFGALQKGRHDPWLSRGAIDASYSMMAAPFALFVVPWPEAHMWPIFAGAVLIHIGYKVLQAMAYSRGAYTVVYPIVRGTGPLFAVIGAWLLFGERFSGVQWLGLAVLLAGIYGLAIYNLRFYPLQRETRHMALGLAVTTGLFVALYTTYDAYGIRAAPTRSPSSRGSSFSTGCRSCPSRGPAGAP